MDNLNHHRNRANSSAINLLFNWHESMTQPLTLRPSQQRILEYHGGRLGVSAVPGSGKTHVLSKLAARIISSGVLQEDQEVLIVTLVNSAVDNFELRIRENFDNPLLALYKYRVRTLHGLAHDILREKPAQAGLEERFTILDEREDEFDPARSGYCLVKFTFRWSRGISRPQPRTQEKRLGTPSAPARNAD